MIDELFDLSQHFILNYNRNYQRYFMGKYPLENRFSIITGARENLQKGNLRENFFVNALMAGHKVTVADRGDFVAADKFVFEVGGKGKGFSQIKDMENSYLALDEIETGIGNKIPLWLFGFLY